MFDKILVAVALEHGDTAETLMNKAWALLNPGGTVHVVHVLEPIPNYVSAEISPEILTDRSKFATEELDAIAKRNTGRDGTLLTEVRIGGSANEILSAAEQHNVDLIMVASHQPGFSTYFIGSTAAKVTRHAQCSVLVLR